MELKIIEESEGLTHVALIGPLDIAGVQEIEIPFLSHTAKRNKPTIVDLSQVTYITSMGIRMLISTAKALSRVQAKMVLLKPQSFVEDTLKAAGLEHAFMVLHDGEEALKRVRGE